ncbi:hypothetical protein C9I57_13485 [Trinickia symbiotica]|uniref:Uncharacterized protein n=1 Tax=Trinickia symbiotica TaxID=863227 RepID=A0A2T3XUE4_9BURK|nr:hypothetical protein [Trinickia symbiotica]PTB20115.1 hypothetical protein C9I57_13485 [Trinickia symbiotica]
MQRRFVAVGIVLLLAAGAAGAQSVPNDQQQSDPQQVTASPQQSDKDSAVGGVPSTRSEYGSPMTPGSRSDCAFRPACEIYFGN